MFIRIKENYKVVKIEKEEVSMCNYEFVEVIGVVIRC
jgi:hypothetical protein